MSQRLEQSDTRWTPVRMGSRVEIKRLGESTISIDDTDEGDVVLAIDLGSRRSAALVRLSPAVATYLAGQLAIRAGAILRDRIEMPDGG